MSVPLSAVTRLDRASLTKFLKLGLRKGTWARLSLEDKGLYRCGLWLARTRGKIANAKLMVRIFEVILKLTSTFKATVLEVGWARARQMHGLFSINGVFDWAPEARHWLRNRSFIAYLGIVQEC